jgi:tetratricopeptide (TPR) repeat protein
MTTPEKLDNLTMALRLRVNRSASVLAACALLCVAAYGATLFHRAYLHDDAWIVGRSAMLDAGAAGAWTLVRTGYWEAAQGSAASVHEYRPLLMLTFLAQRMTTGRDARPMHALNFLLHLSSCALLFLALRRKLPFPAAAAGALAFAVMPSHAEAVAALTGRSELLSAALLLGSWLLLERPAARGRLAGGAALFAAATLVKEHALLFPLFLALSDWTFDGAKPWSRERRRVHAVLFALIAAYLAARLGLAGVPFSGGRPYFADRLTAALTVSRFALARYLWPSVSGLGLCPDFARPLIADALPTLPGSWPPLLLLAALYAAALKALLERRARWAFWLCAPSLFLLPTVHVLAPLDSIGGQRFLYLPSIGLAAGIGALWERARTSRPNAALAAGAALLAWQAWSCASYASAWRGPLPYYERVLACNPVSARARAAYGTELIVAGRAAEGEAQLAESIRLAPALALPYYNLALRRWSQGDGEAAARLVSSSLERDPGSPDAWVLSALVSEAGGRAGEAETSLRRALALMPWHPEANFNLARLELTDGRRERSIPHWRAFLKYAPDDPDAALARSLADGLELDRIAR